jgi:hypothetical protein
MPPVPVGRKTGPKIQKTSFFYTSLEFFGLPELKNFKIYRTCHHCFFLD